MTNVHIERRIEATTGDDMKGAKPPSAPEAREPTALWRRNHKIVSDLFDEYERVDIRSRKKSLASRICVDLTIHTQIEEEILYPAMNEILKDKRLVRRVIDKHTMLKDLIAEMDDVDVNMDGDGDGDDFNAKFKALSDYVKDHVKEEQDEVFPRVIAMKLDVMALSARVASRQEQLVAERARRA